MSLESEVDLQLSLPWHGERHRTIREALLQRLWLTSPRRTHSPYEVLLDYTVASYQMSGKPIQLSAESEMYAYHGTGPGIGTITDGLRDDYTWDFYKLLLVHSPRRLFIARVGGYDEARPESARIEKLCESIDKVMAWYGHALIGDAELGVVVLPEDPAVGWSGVRLGVWAGSKMAWMRYSDTGPESA